MFKIFEQPWTLSIIAILTLLILLMYRRVFAGKQHWWQLALPVCLFVAAFGLDWLVQTDLEKIKAVIARGVKAVEKEDCDAIDVIISTRYRDSDHHTKDSLMRHCRQTLSGPLVERNIKRILDIDISPARAAATITVRIIFDKRSYVYQDFKRQIFTKIELDLQEEQDKGWLITKAEILEIDKQPFKWKDVR